MPERRGERMKIIPTANQKAGTCRGQVTTEYAVVLLLFFGVILLLGLLLAIFTEYGWRMISWAGVDL